METEEKIYFIKLINLKNYGRGWVVFRNGEIMIADAFTIEVAQFTSVQEARAFY